MHRLEALTNLLEDPEHLKVRLFVEGIIIGSLTGAMIALLRYLLGATEQAFPWFYAYLAEHPGNALLWFLVLLVAGWILSLIVRAEPMTSGSGIPQIKGILIGKMSMNWARVLTLKFIGACVGIGAGMSLGREGPSIQLGACVGQGLGRFTHRSHEEGMYLLTTGAGAGLAAAFNAPLAGLIFCLEELTKDFSPYVLMGAISATVMSTAATHIFLGGAPIFHMGQIPVVEGLTSYLILAILGAFVGVIGLLFNPFMCAFLDGFAKAKVPAWVKPTIPLFAAGALGFLLPEVLGGGAPLVDSLTREFHPLALLILLLVVKFLFTMLCFGSGVPGGIFLPMLVMGALAGNIFTELITPLGIMPPYLTADCIVFAMAAYFAAVVKAPVTGSILIMEMTGSFSHMLALMVVSMTAYLVSDVLGGKAVYDLLLERRLDKAEKIKTAFKEHMAKRGVNSSRENL